MWASLRLAPISKEVGLCKNVMLAVYIHTSRPELNIHLKLPIIQFCYSYKLTLLFKPFPPIIQVI